MHIDKDEFIAYARNRTSHADARVVISKQLWSFFDKDDDGLLDENEFHVAVKDFDRGVIIGRVFLVYPSVEVKYKKDFRRVNQDQNEAILGIIPVNGAFLPYSLTSWQNWYDAHVENSSLSLNEVNEPLGNFKYVVPMASGGNGIKLQRHIDVTELKFFSDSCQEIASNIFGETSVEIRATEQLPDVVHVYNTEKSSSVSGAEVVEAASLGLGLASRTQLPFTCSPTPSVSHLGVAACPITDDTSELVTVLVRYPTNRTQDYTCGLSFANVYASEIELDGNGDVFRVGDPSLHVADDLGRVDLAFTPGTSWIIAVDYPSHVFCYGGDATTFKGEECAKSVDGTISTRPSFVLKRVLGGETVVFLDVTERKVDIGLYAGACETPYTNYGLTITPANGCGSSVTVSSEVITGWQRTSSQFNLRKWPYAPMDYYIELETTPDVSSLTMDLLLNDDENEGISCEPPGSTMMEFFSERGMLVQTLSLLKNEAAEAKYVYHGWLCAVAFIDNKYDDYSYSAFTAVREGEVCLGDGGKKDLTLKHLIGTTDINKSNLGAHDVSEEKFIRLKVFEPHLINSEAKKSIQYCSDFESEDNERLGIRVRIQQDVGLQSTNPCHSKNEESVQCVSEIVDGDGEKLYEHGVATKSFGLVKFRDPEDEDNELDYFKIDSKGAEPNLVPPYRRAFRARVERNDGKNVVSIDIERELVPMRSKIRGGGDPANRYISDTKFYATAPIKGLVYTVVHDPPGGDSFASIAQGTSISLSLGLTSTRAVTTTDSNSFTGSGGLSLKFLTGTSLGTGYANMEISLDGGPSLGMKPSEGEDRSRRRLLVSGGEGTGGGGNERYRSYIAGAYGSRAIDRKPSRDATQERLSMASSTSDFVASTDFNDDSSDGSADGGNNKGKKNKKNKKKKSRNDTMRRNRNREAKGEEGEKRGESASAEPSLGESQYSSASQGRAPLDLVEEARLGAQKADAKGAKQNTGVTSFGFSYGHTDMDDGPDVSVTATTDNSWDFFLSLDRSLDSSTDPGVPGRPGDVILGGGFEIVYVRMDTLDVRAEAKEFLGNDSINLSDVQDCSSVTPKSVIINVGDESIAAYYEDQTTRAQILGGNGEYVAAIDVDKGCAVTEFKIVQDTTNQNGNAANAGNCKVEIIKSEILSGNNKQKCGKWSNDKKIYEVDIEALRALRTSSTSDDTVNVKSIYLDYENSKKCLTVVPEIQWLPREPTTYVLSIFTIENRILPELRSLVATANDPNAIFSDDELKEKLQTTSKPDKLNSAIKAIWRARLKSSIDDWRKTLDWSSPDFNPASANTLPLKKEAITNATAKWDGIASPLDSNESVFGKRMKPKLDDVYGTYEGRGDSVGDDEKMLSNMWHNMKVDNFDDEEIEDGKFDYLQTVINAEESGRYPEWLSLCVKKRRCGNPAEISTPDQISELKRRFARFQRSRYGIEIYDEEDVEEAHQNTIPRSEWYPDKNNFVKTYAKGENNEGDGGNAEGEVNNQVYGKNVFVSEEKNSAYSRGMSDIAISDMIENYDKKDEADTNEVTDDSSSGEEAGKLENNDEVKSHYASMDMIDSSVFGGKAEFEFGKLNQNQQSDDNNNYNDNDPMPDPKWWSTSTGSSELKYDSIFLTFSGGGHTLSFSAGMEENIDSFGYSWAIDVEETDSSSNSLETQLGPVGTGTEWGTSESMEVSVDHAMAWAKHGNLETTYTLGDPDPFDKFVVMVSTDKRFGTPLFRTVGGASKCPGEPNTMWRETGVTFQTPRSAGIDNSFIPPDSPALFDVVITNASPYRETVNYAIVLTDNGSSDDFGESMLDLKFTINGDRLRPFGDPLPLNQLESTDSKGNLKYSVLSLEIERGFFEHEYSGIGLRLVSACEFRMGTSDWLYRAPIEDKSSLGTFRWERKCPGVTWDKTTFNKFSSFVASTESPPFVNITLMNPDPMNLWTSDRWTPEGVKKTKEERNEKEDENVGWDSKKSHLVHPNVEFVRVQWRKTGVGEWISASDIDWSSWEEGEDPSVEKTFENFFKEYPYDKKEESRRRQAQALFKLDVNDADLQCATSRGEGCSLKWNLVRDKFLSGFNDGSYEVRAKVFCSGYDSFATSEVRGSVTDEPLSLEIDVTAPTAISTHVFGRTFSVAHTEPVRCPQLQSQLSMPYIITRVKDCDGNAVENGTVADVHIYSYFSFICMTDTPYSLVVNFPDESKAPDGTYEITVNANAGAPSAEKVTDYGNNAVKRQVYKGITIGDECETKNGVTSIKAATEPNEDNLSCSDDYIKYDGYALTNKDHENEDAQAKCWNKNTSDRMDFKAMNGVSLGMHSCEDVCNKCGDACHAFFVSGDQCIFRKTVRKFKNEQTAQNFVCAKKAASSTKLGVAGAKTDSGRARSKMSIHSFGARLGLVKNLHSKDQSSITMKNSTIARALFATVSVAAVLVYFTTRRLYSPHRGSRAGDENRASQENATLLREKHSRDFINTRESSYGSVI